MTASDTRVAVLAGAGRGIGAATARRLASAGVRVEVLDAFGLDHPSYPLATDADREAWQGVSGVSTRAVDLRDAEATVATLAEVAKEHGQLDVAVAFAGVVDGGMPLWETPLAVRDELWRSNATTMWNLARAAMPHLLNRPAEARPTFVGVTSVAGSQGLFGLSAYVVAKHAAVGVVRALAADVAGTEVTVCGVAPGATDTSMLASTAALYGLADRSELAQGQHGGRVLRPEEVAAVVAFATAAGPAVHGAILAADGGFRHG